MARQRGLFKRLGYSQARLAKANRSAIHLFEQIRDELQFGESVATSGCVGPRGDGYVASNVLSVRAARRAAMPVAISFTVETDENLATGQPLGEAIHEVDGATTSYASYYMLTCTHPAHFAGVLAGDEPWSARISSLRANASRKSHAELNESAELRMGDPRELASSSAALRRGPLSDLNILGGCCGTHHRQIERIAINCIPLMERRPGGGRRL